MLVAVWIGTSINQLGWSLLVATWIWLLWQYLEYRKVLFWSSNPLTKPANSAEHWFTLAYQPYRALVRQRRRTKNMAARMRQILTLTEVIPDGVIVLNANNDIEGMNSAAVELMGFEDADLNLPIASLVRDPEFVNFLREEEDEPLEFTAPGEPQRIYEARRVRIESGRSIVLVRDITTLNRLLTMRQNFVANVSHELRTPLTVVNGYLESLEDPEMNDGLKLELIPRLAPPMRRMQSLVQDLLLLTQLESAPDKENRQPVNMCALLERAKAELDGLTVNAEQIKIDCQAPHRILGFETELHSVCVNLISNGLRYSDPGKPITVGWHQISPTHARLSVEDRGWGIPNEHLDRLTERFYRVDMAGARAKGGTGLGLAIVKHVLRRHESELQVTSELGVGSNFFCDFMLEEAEIAGEQTSVQTQPSAGHPAQQR